MILFKIIAIILCIIVLANANLNCEPNPCHNEGICVVDYMDYKCECQEDFGGINCDTNYNCIYYKKLLQ